MNPSRDTHIPIGQIIAQVALVAFVVLATVGIGLGLAAAKPEAEPEDRTVTPPLVETHTVAFETVQVEVPSQGTVRPHTEIQLVPQVTGKVVRISAQLVEGGFFNAGDELLAIDPSDYELRVVQQEAEVARARTMLAQEEAQREASLREWAQMHAAEPAPPLVRREPQLEQAKAELERARSLLDQARLNLKRCVLTAPFRGRVRNRAVDQGQYVVAGQALATLFSVDWFELVLPVPDDELTFLQLPRPGQPSTKAPVLLTARFGDKLVEYEGCLDRTSGAINERTRQVPLIIRVNDPYGLDTPGAQEGDERPPMQLGMFLQARIAGRTLENIAKIPRGALRDGNQVLVIQDGGALSFRSVEVVRRERDHVLVASGVEPGDTLCLTDLEATEGMIVRTEIAPENLEESTRSEQDQGGLVPADPDQTVPPDQPNGKGKGGGN